MKHVFCSVALLALSQSVPAAEPLDSIAARMARPAVIRGGFEQTKDVSGFAKPLRSQGRFLVAQDKGVLWDTQRPFASQLKLTRNDIVATQNGNVSFQLNAGKEPTVRVITELMFSLLNGNLDTLANHFRVEGKLSGRTWTLQLTPKQTALMRVMQHVELSGDQFVRSIRIDESNGDRTRITFSPQDGTAPRLSREEEKRFD